MRQIHTLRSSEAILYSGSLYRKQNPWMNFSSWVQPNVKTSLATLSDSYMVLWITVAVRNCEQSHKATLTSAGKPTRISVHMRVNTLSLLAMLLAMWSLSVRCERNYLSFKCILHNSWNSARSQHTWVTHRLLPSEKLSKKIKLLNYICVQVFHKPSFAKEMLVFLGSNSY